MFLFCQKQGIIIAASKLFCSFNQEGIEPKNGGRSMKGQLNTQYGKVLINTDVIAIYAGSVAVECFGIVGMAAVNMKDGLVRLLKRDYLNHGINVSLKDNKITLDFHVIVSYGVSISTVSDNLISTVKYQVEEFTGWKSKKSTSS